MPSYVVFVDDNYDYMSPDARYRLGEFETAEAALAECRRIVDRCIDEHRAPGAAPAGLMAAYKSFGDDPWISAQDGAADVKFSAWDYAEERCREICEEVLTG